MPNKPDEFGIKFWMAADVKTKYILSSFPYMGNDDSRPAGVTLGVGVTLFCDYLNLTERQVKT